MKGHDDSIQQKISQKISDTELFNHLQDKSEPDQNRKIGIALKLANPFLVKRIALLEEELLDQGYIRLDGIGPLVDPFTDPYSIFTVSVVIYLCLMKKLNLFSKAKNEKRDY